MKNVILLLVFITAAATGFSQNVMPYQLFSQKGKKVTFKKMAKELADKDVILFGEYHDDPIAHWMQLKLTKYLFEQDTNLVLAPKCLNATDSSL